jgi:hypothetical protein
VEVRSADKLPTSTPAPPAKESRPGGARSERPGATSVRYDDPVETPTNSRAVPIAVGAIVLFALIAVAAYAMRGPAPTSSPPATADTVRTDASHATTGDVAPTTAPGPTTSLTTAPSASDPPSSTAPSASASGTGVAPEDDEKKPLQWRIQQALARGKTVRAYDLAVQYTTSSPNSPRAWYLRGGVEQQLGKNAKASYRKCAELAPLDSDLQTECSVLGQ